MMWLMKNIKIIESALQSVWYLVYVASAIVLIIMGIGYEEAITVVLGILGILVILINETLKAFKALEK